jgi:hypothetical protein
MSQPPGESSSPPPGSPYGPPPYAGPPSYGPSPYGSAPYGAAPYGSAPYGSAPYAAAPYGSNPYDAAQYVSPYGAPVHSGPQHAGPGGPAAPAYGYAGYPYGPPPAAGRVSDASLGWVLLGAGVLAFIGAVLPWATVGPISVAGTSGDGALTLFFGMVIGAMGLVIGLRQGRLWASILATVFSGFMTLTAVIDIAHISTFTNRFEGLDINVRVGAGLWLTLVAGVGSLVCAVLAIIKRRPAA